TEIEPKKASRLPWKNKTYDVNVIEEKKKTESVSFKELFRFAKKTDVFYMILATCAAICHGAALPLLLLIFGNLVDTFTDRSFNLCTLNLTALSLTYCPSGIILTSTNFLSLYKLCNFTGSNFTVPTFDLTGKVRQQALILVGIGCGAIIFAYIQIAFWCVSAERQTRAIREAAFRAIMNKEILYFDTHKTALIFSKLTSSMTAHELKAYGKAGAVAEEVFSSIRTVFSYNGVEHEQTRYERHLDAARDFGIKKGAFNGVTLGFVWFVIFCAYALGFWYGAKLVRDEGFNIGSVLIVFFAILIAVFSLGQGAPHLQSLAQARGAAYYVWDLIDSPSKIISNSVSGLKTPDLVGIIEFSEVNFVYPTRPNTSILNGLSFDAKSGQTVALVGSSGCGKSTCIQLLQRFYDPISGSVSIDGHSVSEYNLHWLRQHIGVVSQEPILFAATIKENIKYGKDNVTDSDIEDAAKKANAHDFIMTLPDRYETMVGERGAQLSGGQKQRIAIARALIRNPKILLLDEATSALDNESEKIVQDALDKASKGRTTLVIAHRLSTIRNANKIVVIHEGTTVEEGDHETLMNKRGNYYALVQAQNLQIAEENEEDEDEDIYPDEINVRQQRRSTVASLSPSMLATIHEAKIADNDGEKNVKKPSPSWTMLKMNSPEWLYIVFGCIACICNGGIQPAYGVILSKLIAVFQECDRDVQEHNVLVYILLFIGFGVLMLISMFLQSYLFACSGEKLTKRLRAKVFRVMLRQDMAYFDDPKNNTGALCTRLAVEASAVQGATGIRIGIMLQNFASLGVGIILGFVYGWALTLMLLGFIPLIVIGGFLQSKLVSGFASKDKRALEDAGKVAVEAIQNIRTVAQLTKEERFGNEYAHLVEIPYSVFNCVVFGAQSVGQTASLVPDYSKATESASNILDLFARKPNIDNGSTDGEQIANFNGGIEFDGVYFVYPNRPEAIVLRNLKLKIMPGQKIALVGGSGCGKSTTVQLLERFYDVVAGRLLLDSKDVRSLNLQWYRSQIGIVSQEPILFDVSIKENIAYGDNSREVPMSEIIEASKNANIHSFIEKLPMGYDTNCGSKGTQLSGGQKQRIAIARALVRNPKILLLDEATSALDQESENVVQEALDRAQQNRTSITIAHRLSTIQNADLICVIRHGRVVESGRHSELLAKQGYYFKLAQKKLK
ncbi:unnamed protein product, partial [Didymodactylos carnosus]